MTAPATRVVAAGRSASATASFRAAVRGAMQRITWRVAGAALALASAINVWLAAEVVLYLDPQQSPWVQSVSTLLISVLMTFSLMFTTFVADELVAASARPLPAYAWAIVIGSAAGALVQWPVHHALGIPTHNDYPGAAAEIVAMQPATVFFRYLIWGTIVVWIYVSRRAELRATARMDAAQLRRAETQRRTLQTRLQTLQAQVEPRFLQNTLARVRDRYEIDPVAAGNMLDRLIAYLRAALPQLRDPHSTLVRELSLVRAYVDVLGAGSVERVRVDADVPTALCDAPMPPMVLLPVVDYLLGDLREQPAGTGTLRIFAEQTQDRMRVGCGPVSARSLDGTGLDAIRQRLRALYGERGGLELDRSAAGATTAFVEIPRDPAHGSHR